MPLTSQVRPTLPVYATGTVAGNAGQALVHGGRPLMRRLCSTVLGMEAVILLLAIVPAKTLEHCKIE